MVSMMPYSESRDSKFMYDLLDLRGPKPSPTIRENTIYDFLLKNKHKFSKFIHILKVSEMENLFNDIEFDKTLFLPINEGIPDEIYNNMDKNLAINIIKFSCLNRKIDKNIMKRSPYVYMMTNYRYSPRLLVTNMNDITELNGESNIIYYDLNFKNGMIHIIDKILIPSSLV